MQSARAEKRARDREWRRARDREIEKKEKGKMQQLGSVSFSFFGFPRHCKFDCKLLVTIIIEFPNKYVFTWNM